MELSSGLLSIKRFLYLIAVAGSVVVLSRYLPDSQLNWLIWSAFTFPLFVSGLSVWRRMIIVLIVGLITCVLVFVSGLIVTVFPLFVMYLFFITFVCTLLGQGYPTYFFLLLIVNILVLAAAFLPVDWGGNVERSLMIMLGAGIAAFFQWVFYPFFIRDERRSLAVMSLQHLKHINEAIFSCLLQPDYADNIYLYERRLHLQKGFFLQSVEKLREAGHMQLSEKLDLLYGNMMDYAQIRRRVSDHATFSVCSQELHDIFQAINQAMNRLVCYVKGKNIVPDTDNLEEKINRLDDNYQHVLQTAAPEPLVFALFIDSLNHFCKLIKDFRQK